MSINIKLWSAWMIISIFEMEIYRVINFKLYLLILHINQLQAPIMHQIMEVENSDTDTSCSHEESCWNEETKHAKTHRNIDTSQKRQVVLNKWLAETLTDLETGLGQKIPNTWRKHTAWNASRHWSDQGACHAFRRRIKIGTQKWIKH